MKRARFCLRKSGSGTRSSLEDARARLGEPAQRVDRGHQLHRVGLGARLALLAREQRGEVVELVDDRLAGAAHVAGAVGERELGPERLHLATSSTTDCTSVGRDGRHRAQPRAVDAG